jgi:hypothetical protein
LLISPESAGHLIEAELELTITLEVVYGHAWAPDALLSQKRAGITTISPDQIVRSKK